ncbi:ferredoxin reductase family protein [Schumannella luteola]|jgi:predicted ferric reductase
MTATATRPTALPPSRALDREAPHRRRRLRADLLVTGAWASAALALALYLSTGLVDLSSPSAAITSLGIASGLIGSDLVLVMLVLAARIPAIDRAVGHDRAMAAHRSLGKPAFYLLLAHAALLTIGYSLADGSSVVSETVTLFSSADMPLAYLSLGLFVAVVVTSLVAVHRRMPYEAWHVVHLLSYAAVLAGLPHQLSMGGVLAEGMWQRPYWIALYVVALGSIVVFRVLRPLVASVRHEVTVESVERIAPDAFSIHLAGRDLDRLGARGGQFFFWRFWAPGTWWHAHPISLSAVPTARSARITVRELGEGTRSLSRLQPGTRVSFSGPFGLFTSVVRRRRKVAVLAAGIGITPVLSLLSRLDARAGDVTVIARGSDETELYLWQELQDWADVNGMRAYRSVGSRARGRDAWLSAHDVARGVTTRSVFPDLADSDVYLCGPDGWADAAESALLAAGASRESIHRERFDW